MQLENRFYTSTEVAEILGVSLRSVYRYLEESKITADVKTATGRHRFTRQNILDFLYPNKNQPVQAPVAVPVQVQAVTAQATVIQETAVTTHPVPPVAPVVVAPVVPINTAVHAVPVTDALSSNITPEGTPVAPVGQVATDIPADNTSVTTDVSVTTDTPADNISNPVSKEPVASDVPVTVEAVKDSATSTTSVETPTLEVVTDTPVEPVTPKDAATLETPAKVEAEAPASKEAKDENSVDWLAKFKAAADKYKQDQVTDTPKDVSAPQVVASTPAAPVIEQKKAVSVTPPEAPKVAPAVVTTPAVKTPVAEPVKAATKADTEVYYRSGVGGLKDIAQSVDKSAKKSSLPYAFTLNAGLSLHKPIKPFSTLHAYVRPQDKELFEKSLQLSVVGKETSQLCLLFTNDSNIFSDATELHGLSVVSNARLKKDLTDNGEAGLASEL